MDYRFVESPLGRLVLGAESEAVTWLGLADAAGGWIPPEGWRENPGALDAAARQLDEYFAGRRRRFEVALAPLGTPFQRRVWEQLRSVPYGTTRSYRDLAGAVGRPTASRAVGLANARNPIPIFIPCHRIVGSNGTLTGYAWGIDAKRRLLALEGALDA